MIWSSVYAVAFGLLLAVGHTDLIPGRLWWQTAFLGGAGVVFLVLFILSLVRQPAEIDHERAKKIDDLELQLGKAARDPRCDPATLRSRLSEDALEMLRHIGARGFFTVKVDGIGEFVTSDDGWQGQSPQDPIARMRYLSALRELERMFVVDATKPEGRFLVTLHGWPIVKAQAEEEFASLSSEFGNLTDDQVQFLTRIRRVADEGQRSMTAVRLGIPDGLIESDKNGCISLTWKAHRYLWAQTVSRIEIPTHLLSGTWG